MPAFRPGLLVGGLLFALAAPAPALAGPAQVTVRVAGVSHASAPTAVTTMTTPIAENGNPCSGTSAGGALDAAVGHANWDAAFTTQFGGAWTLNSIYGESHAFGSGAFWSIDVNGVPAPSDLCHTEVNAGDQVLFYAACDPFTPVAGVPCFGEPLELSVPRTVVPGQPSAVTVTESDTDTTSFITTISPSPGATVTADGHSATTDAGGHATLTVTSAGPIAVHATKGNRVDDTQATCATNGHDGNCDTTAPPPVAGQSGTVCLTDGHDGLCGTVDHDLSHALIGSPRQHQRLRHGHGPRRLVGTVMTDPSGLRKVELRLTRTTHGRCSTFVATTTTFRAISPCGARHGSWFSVGTNATWSYLLPHALGPGRYVLDVRATDGAGSPDTHLTIGHERVIFSVA